MYDREKELWIELIEEFKNLPVLWNQKNKDYTNKTMRNEATEYLLKYYKKIDKHGTAYTMKKKLENMRTTFNRERKKASQTPGYLPSLWYYEHFTFLEEALDASKRKEIIFNFNTSNNKIFLEKNSPNSTPKKRSLKRRADDSDEESSTKFQSNDGYKSINVEPLQSAEEEDEVECTKITPPAPKRRIYDLLQKQERFIDTASKIITRKEQEWEVIGKSIGLQLMGLSNTQRTIANKLISDAIFFGSMGKLTVDSFVNVDSIDRGTPEPIEEHLDEDFEDIKDGITYVDV